MNPLPPDQLMPPDYTGWNFNHDIFANLICEIKPKTIIEVGTWKGMSAIMMYRAAEALNLDFKLICVDTWLGGIEHMPGQPFGNLYQEKFGYPKLYQQFLSNMQIGNCIERLETIPNTSINAARWLKKNNVKAQLIYVDGSHESPDVYNDVRHYYDILDQGGIMFGDDYQHPPLNSDLNKFCDEFCIPYDVVDGNFWVIKK